MHAIIATLECVPRDDASQERLARSHRLPRLSRRTEVVLRDRARSERSRARHKLWASRSQAALRAPIRAFDERGRFEGRKLGSPAPPSIVRAMNAPRGACSGNTLDAKIDPKISRDSTCGARKPNPGRTQRTDIPTLTTTAIGAYGMSATRSARCAARSNVRCERPRRPELRRRLHRRAPPHPRLR